MQSQRKTPTAYLVLLSMAIILFFEPRFILQLGFQMSYLAVFGILFLHPLMQLKLKHKALQWFWNLTTVSLSAQIAVAPISIYHFHQFPGLFLLSNWAILPFIGLFLYVGLGCIIWLLFFALPPPLVYLLDGLVAKMNQLVFWIGAQENFIFLFGHRPTYPRSLVCSTSLQCNLAESKKEVLDLTDWVFFASIAMASEYFI